MNQPLTPAEVTRATAMADTSYELALAIEIDCPEMFQTAGDELRAITKREKEIDELRLSLTRPIDESKRRIMDLFRTPLERLQEASGLLRRSMTAYQTAEREKADKLRREAEAKARAEREEQERIRREAERVERQAREDAEALRRAGDAAAAEAAEAEASRAAETAAEAQAQVDLAEIAPPSLPSVAPPKATGISTRQNWKAEVIDLRELIIAAAAAASIGDTTLLGYLLPNEKAIGQVARALKDQARIPGVRVYAEDTLAVRAA